MKRLFLFLLSLILLVSLCIPIFAIDKYVDYIMYPPTDLGSSTYNQYAYSGQRKQYIKIDTSVDINYNCQFRTYSGSGDTALRLYNIQIINGRLITTLDNSVYGNEYINVVAPIIDIEIESSYYYIPVYVTNGILNYTNEFVPPTLTYYLSDTTDITTIQREAYDVGYHNGYNIGYSDGVENGGIALNNLPLVDKLTTFIATFTGDGTAQYITPLALCMILILIYILFIRWVLNLSKSAKLVKLTDIIVLISCICILLIFYIPMINFTITQHQIVDSVETTTVEETVRVVRDPITVVTDETGEILIGPVGTVKLLYETTSFESIDDATQSALSIIETTGG